MIRYKIRTQMPIERIDETIINYYQQYINIKGDKKNDKRKKDIT